MSRIFLPLWGACYLLLALPHQAYGRSIKKAHHHSFTWELGTGATTFQDIQVPVDYYRDNITRADGRADGIENSTHLGFPVIAELSYQPFSYGPMSASIESYLMHASSITGPKETLQATYNRIGLGLTIDYRFWLDTFDLSLTTGFERIAFMNVSNGHGTLAPYFRPQIDYHINHRATLSTSYKISSETRMRYFNGEKWVGEALPRSTAKSSSLAFEAGYALTPSAAVQLGFEQESCILNLTDVYAYRDLGLSLRQPKDLSREYQMLTSTIKLSFKKGF